MIIKLLNILWKVWDRLLMFFAKASFSKIGKGCVFHPTNSDFNYSKISLGDDVQIGNNARFWATESGIKIGNHVTFAPSVSIIAGNHRYDLVGKWITQYRISDKRLEDDLPVIIENDIWVGTNVTILNGVKVGRGAIIAAGAVVNKEVPPYSIVGGVPSRVIGHRFHVDQIIEHEKVLYPENERYTREQLVSFVEIK